jgi:TetR/AcrR family transcriptional regulator, fatty acid metabolism regulator protein
MRGVAKTKAARVQQDSVVDRGEASSGTEAAPGGDKFQRILDAAIEVIAENGFFESPVSKIAERAGVADGTVYLYFKSKDELLRVAIDRALQRFYDGVEREFQHVTDPREQLETIGRLHLETVTVNRSMAILMQTEVRQSAKFISEFSHKHLVHYSQIVREVIRRGQEQGVFRKDLSDGVVAHCWFGAIDELLTTAIFTGRVYDPKATTAQVLDVLLHGIGV